MPQTKGAGKKRQAKSEAKNPAKAEAKKKVKKVTLRSDGTARRVPDKGPDWLASSRSCDNDKSAGRQCPVRLSHVAYNYKSVFCKKQSSMLQHARGLDLMTSPAAANALLHIVFMICFWQCVRDELVLC